MLSHSQQTLLRKLSSRKHRWRERRFVAEGRKVVSELLAASLKPRFLLAEQGTAWQEQGAIMLPAQEFRQWSNLESADEVLGVFQFPEFAEDKFPELVVVLDEVRDPGNLGTIIRTCDWFGVKRIYCVKGCTDVYNAKSIQSSMGSVARVEVIYDSAQNIYSELSGEYQLVCADMKGNSLTAWNPEYPIALVLGSESHGPSEFWRKRSDLVSIPAAPGAGAESLNVAIAGAVILGRLRLGGG